MIPWQLLDRTKVPGGGDRVLELYRRGDEYSIRIDGAELMNSRVHASEEALATVAILGQGIAKDNVGGVLTLNQHVGQANGVGLLVEFLVVEVNAGSPVEGRDVCVNLRKHASRAAGAVVDGADDALLGQRLLVAIEQEVAHQAHHLAWREVLACRFVALL